LINSSIFRVNQRFATANGNHRRIAFDCGLKTLLSGTMSLSDVEYSRILAAPGASQIARVQRFELEHHRKLRRLAKFVLDNVTGNFFGQREWKSHK